MVKIYTKTGDQGQTSLFTGHRVPKNSHYIDALGTVDECNSAIGAAISLLPAEKKFSEVKAELEFVQHALFDIGAALATPRSLASSPKISKTRFDSDEITLLEKWIDKMELELPKLTYFILPGGDPAASFLHLARSICRRAERDALRLAEKADVSENVLVYLNRLSDYLFVLSRYVNLLAGCEETRWEHNKDTHPFLAQKD